jgi:hypothetical protein
MSDQFFIVYGKDVVKVERQITESFPIFIQRVEFLIYALDQGHSINAAQTLSYAYQNKVLYNAKYPADFDDKCTKIIEVMNKDP